MSDDGVMMVLLEPLTSWSFFLTGPKEKDPTPHLLIQEK
jgi:hypothetical protein